MPFGMVSEVGQGIGVLDGGVDRRDTLPDTPFRQFDPVMSCLFFTICFAI